MSLNDNEVKQPPIANEMAGLIASKDWSTTALGDQKNWSPSLRLIVGIMTASGFPMAVRWGPDLVLIYNDGYRPILADKHPWALGLPFRVVWPEVVSELIPLQEAILAGESPGDYSEDRLLTIRRRGLDLETAHFTVSYSPVPDPSSPTGIGGVLVTAVETSERLRVEKALALKTQELSEANRRLHNKQTLYRSALAAGRMGTWETDFVAKTRLWTPEGMLLFGINLPGGQGHVGGDQDEYWSALHPDDRPLVQKFHELADEQDSFTSEYRVVWADGTTLWLRGHGQVVARTPDGKAHRLVSIVTDVTERKAAEDHAQFLMHELSHRSKNLLAVIQSISRRTARTTTTMEEFESRFGRRLQGLAASHDVLIRNSWQGAPLADLMRQQLVPFTDIQSSRVKLAGPDIVVTAEAAQAIGLAIHELSTNAIKYGALSAPAGKVKISWALDSESLGSRELVLKWVEQGGPRVVSPSRNGFGHLVIGDMIERSLNARVTLKFATQGLEWSVSMPATNLVIETQTGSD
ncbi:HWE histidine kinase domain-containing protein [Bradyrhizobium sp. LTSPM299]|uniref:HWE histidine kinase domain-containing protein n=1 Tax=Bradyrhizobium sp. LTSPM299 TaxID=1619233 RepID=UPI0006787E20|nr:HWE histidine kinase domain-containing protein [Bradyrhizobium sp. LTSPM299]